MSSIRQSELQPVALGFHMSCSRYSWKGVVWESAIGVIKAYTKNLAIAYSPYSEHQTKAGVYNSLEVLPCDAALSCITYYKVPAVWSRRSRWPSEKLPFPYLASHEGKVCIPIMTARLQEPLDARGRGRRGRGGPAAQVKLCFFFFFCGVFRMSAVHSTHATSSWSMTFLVCTAACTAGWQRCVAGLKKQAGIGVELARFRIFMVSCAFQRLHERCLRRKETDAPMHVHPVGHKCEVLSPLIS